MRENESFLNDIHQFLLSKWRISVKPQFKLSFWYMENKPKQAVMFETIKMHQNEPFLNDIPQL